MVLGIRFQICGATEEKARLPKSVLILGTAIVAATGRSDSFQTCLDYGDGSRTYRQQHSLSCSRIFSLLIYCL